MYDIDTCLLFYFFFKFNLAASKCSDDRLKPFNGTCYLFVSYPEVDWYTAQQICAGIHGELASIKTAEEQRYFLLFSSIGKLGMLGMKSIQIFYT